MIVRTEDGLEGQGVAFSQGTACYVLSTSRLMTKASRLWVSTGGAHQASARRVDCVPGTGLALLETDSSVCTGGEWSAIRRSWRERSPDLSLVWPKEGALRSRLADGTLDDLQVKFSERINRWIDISPKPELASRITLDLQGSIFTAGPADAGVLVAVTQGGVGQVVRLASIVPGIDACVRTIDRWSVSLSLSFMSLDPDLPRDLVTHETHPDDRPFLFGPAGATRLTTTEIKFANLAVTYQRSLPGHPDRNWLVRYTLRIPESNEVREVRQNENDFRLPTEGSFIYTEHSETELAQELGVGVSFPLRQNQRAVLTVLASVGYWDLAFEKGWDRFSQRQPALSARATGLSLAPQAELSFGTRAHRLELLLAYRFLELSYDAASLEDSSGEAWEVGLGYRWTTGAGSRRNRP
ncbi:MAG: hypothetical protein AAF560_22490 [Acidobacteriota bacterium]